MEISDLNVKNFRTLRDFSMQFKGGVNVLVGPNGCGKSNIIAVINECCSVLMINETRINPLDVSYFIKEPIVIKSNFIHEKIKMAVEISYKGEHGLDIHPKTLPTQSIMNYYKIIPSNRLLQQSSSMIHLSNHRKNPRDRFNLENYRTEELFYEYYDMWSILPESLNQVSEVIRTLYPGFEDVHISPNPKDNTAELLVIINGTAFPFHLLSSGLQQLLSLILVVHFSKYCLILIDEPELHMNPRLLIGLMDLIKKSAEKNQNQFIIGTHSRQVIATPGFNIIPLEYVKTDRGYTTKISEELSKEFAVNRTG